MTDMDEILQQIADCERRESKLTEWEQQFIDSLSHQLGRGHGLSPKQTEVLDRIWERVT